MWRDWALVGVLVPLAVLEGVLRPDLPWLAVVITVGLVPTLLWRRTRPLLMLAIAFATSSLATLVLAIASSSLATLVTGGESADTYTLVYLLLLVYALFRWGSGREAAIGLAIMAATVLLSVALDRLVLADAGGAFAIMFSAVALGVALRYRTSARRRELDHVKLLEREQLARDLHDTVAHHVSAMAIRAQAGLATAASRPEAATDALRLIEAEAAVALDEMRAMVRVLRRDEAGGHLDEGASRLDEGADLAPGRRVTDLQQLASSSGPYTPSIEVEISGDVDDLPPPVGAAIYRLAQESVTNARRHARHATRIEVRLAADDTSVHLRVSDDGDLLRQTASPGYGLMGMIERAGLLGGTCVAGPNHDRGWTVTAVLPRSGPAT